MPEFKPLIIKGKVKATDRYRKYLEVISLFLKRPLTKQEIDVLDEFYTVNLGEITTESRKEVRENLNISSENLNNYIRILRKDGYINGNLVHPVFHIGIPESDNFNIDVRLQVVL